MEDPFKKTIQVDYNEFESIHSRYNFRLIDLNLLFQKNISVKFIDELYKLRIIPRKHNFYTSTMAKFFYHFLITEIYNQILSRNTTERCVIYFSPNNFNKNVKFNLYEHLAEAPTNRLIQKYLKYISKYLPVKVYQNKYPFIELNYHIIERTGEGIEIISQLQQLIQKKNDKFTFEKVIKQAHKMEMLWFERFLKDQRKNSIWYA